MRRPSVRGGVGDGQGEAVSHRAPSGIGEGRVGDARDGGEFMPLGDRQAATTSREIKDSRSRRNSRPYSAAAVASSAS